MKKHGLLGRLMHLGDDESGPSLFDSLRSKTMEEVLSGTWEKTDPGKPTRELTNEISEYVEGWHAERGIVYDPKETFETYLRRVIVATLRGSPPDTASQGAPPVA